MKIGDAPGKLKIVPDADYYQMTVYPKKKDLGGFGCWVYCYYFCYYGCCGIAVVRVSDRQVSLFYRILLLRTGRLFRLHRIHWRNLLEIPCCGVKEVL